MNAIAVRIAKQEAERFVKLADQVIEKFVWIESHQTEYVDAPSKLSGALRRSSLDLTRALAEMRKP